MKSSTPLVTIGIPTYNRAEMLRRSIDSVLCQDYSAIEVIISDNASTDHTQDICEEFSKKDDRIRYVRQLSNVGAAANFSDVLKNASGEYFMWLGDDDWIDTSYVSHCVFLLEENLDLALVSGAPIYYRNGLRAFAGKLFDLMEESWVVRVARYYMRVTDNGMFYGVMRAAQLQRIPVPNAMGGDWHLIASVVSTGKSKMSPLVFVHRELGGATTSYRQIARSLGLPTVQAIFPMTTTAFGACQSIVFAGSVYRKRRLLDRVILAAIVFPLVIVRPVIGYAGRAKRLIRRGILLVANRTNNK